MRKVYLFIASMFLMVSTFATSKPNSAPLMASSIMIPLGKNGKTISLLDISRISVKDFQLITNKKLNLFEKIQFKISQREIRKSINDDGTLRDKKIVSLLKGEMKPSEGKSQVVALLLVIFVGGLGIHRFYLGYTWQGIVQILTLGGFGIWWLIDLIRIITGDLKPKDGEYGTKL